MDNHAILYMYAVTFGVRKLRVPGLSCGIVCVILRHLRPCNDNYKADFAALANRCTMRLSVTVTWLRVMIQ